MKEEQQQTLFDDRMEAISRASVAEMLYEMSRTLARLRGCAHFSAAQQSRIDAAHQHIEGAVEEWIVDATSSRHPPASSHESDPKPAAPESPERALDCVTEMLAIYHDNMNESDFTPMQLQRLMIAVHNLAVIAQELMKNVH